MAGPLHLWELGQIFVSLPLSPLLQPQVVEQRLSAGAHVRSWGQGDPIRIHAELRCGLFGEWERLYLYSHTPLSTRTVVCGTQDLGLLESKCRWHKIDLPQLSPPFCLVHISSQGSSCVPSTHFQLLLPILTPCLYLHSPLGGLIHMPTPPGFAPPAHPQLLLRVADEVANISAPDSALSSAPTSVTVKGNGWQPHPSMCSGPNPESPLSIYTSFVEATRKPTGLTFKIDPESDHDSLPLQQHLWGPGLCLCPSTLTLNSGGVCLMTR